MIGASNWSSWAEARSLGQPDRKGIDAHKFVGSVDSIVSAGISVSPQTEVYHAFCLCFGIGWFYRRLFFAR